MEGGGGGGGGGDDEHYGGKEGEAEEEERGRGEGGKEERKGGPSFVRPSVRAIRLLAGNKPFEKLVLNQTDERERALVKEISRNMSEISQERDQFSLGN